MSELRDFLVGVGFKIDEASQKLAEDAVKRTEERNTTKTKAETAKRVAAERGEAAARERERRNAEQKRAASYKAALGTAQGFALQFAGVKATIALATELTAAGIVRAVDRAATSFDRLTYLSRIAESSPANIGAFGYAAAQTGSTQEEGDAALAEFGRKLKDDRQRTAYERMLKDLGISTRTAAGEFRDSADILTDLGDKMRKIQGSGAFGYSRAMGTGRAFGLDENISRSVMNPDFRKRIEEQKAIQRKIGSDPNAAAARGTAFEQSMRRLREVINGVETRISTVLFAKLEPFLDKLAAWFLANGDRISNFVSKVVDDLIRLAVAIGEKLADTNWDEVLERIETFALKVGDVMKVLAGDKGVVLQLGLLAAAIGVLAAIALPKWLLLLLGGAALVGSVGRSKAEPATPGSGTSPGHGGGGDGSGGGSRSEGGGQRDGIRNAEGQHAPASADAPTADRRNWWQRTMPKWLGGKDAPGGSLGKGDGKTPAGSSGWLDPRSQRELAGVNKELVENLLAASKESGVKFKVRQGRRSPEEAAANAAAGIGVRNSQHIYGAAADLVMLDPKTGQKSLDRDLYKKFAESFNRINRARGTNQRWLGDLPGRWGGDIYHFDQGIRYGQSHKPDPYGSGPGPTKEDLDASRRDAYEGPQNPFLKGKSPAPPARPLGDTPALHQSMLENARGDTHLASGGVYNIRGGNIAANAAAARSMADLAHRDMLRRTEAANVG